MAGNVWPRLAEYRIVHRLRKKAGGTLEVSRMILGSATGTPPAGGSAGKIGGL